jgi:hypothetical protein
MVIFLESKQMIQHPRKGSTIWSTYVACTQPGGHPDSPAGTCRPAGAHPRDRMRSLRTDPTRRTGWGTDGWCRHCGAGIQSYPCIPVPAARSNRARLKESNTTWGHAVHYRYSEQTNNSQLVGGQLTSHAAGPGVPSVANRTSAAGRMRPRLANGVGAARLHVTCVTTRAFHTLVRVGTVAVRLAARHGGH